MIFIGILALFLAAILLTHTINGLIGRVETLEARIDDLFEMELYRKREEIDAQEDC